MTKPYTNIYFDFEFIDDGREIIPISLGMCTDPFHGSGISMPGQTLYLEYQFDLARTNDWVRENVIPHLAQPFEPLRAGVMRLPRHEAAQEIVAWVKQVCGDTEPRFWGYYPSYDWVLLCQHFGAMTQGPEGWPIRPECLMQFADQLGVSKDDFPVQPENAHNALADAKWNRTLHDYLYKRWEADAQ